MEGRGERGREEKQSILLGTLQCVLVKQSVDFGPLESSVKAYLFGGQYREAQLFPLPQGHPSDSYWEYFVLSQLSFIAVYL